MYAYVWFNLIFYSNPSQYPSHFLTMRFVEDFPQLFISRIIFVVIFYLLWYMCLIVCNVMYALCGQRYVTIPYCFICLMYPQEHLPSLIDLFFHALLLIYLRLFKWPSRNFPKLCLIFGNVAHISMAYGYKPRLNFSR